MYENLYRIAEKNILIQSNFDRVHRLCEGYEATGTADFCICISPDDLELERVESDITAKREGHVKKCPSDAYLETLAVYRQIAERMPTEDTILFHGSAIAVEGQGYLFTASSGTGKSTHTRLWCELLGDRAVMINDDKPLVHVAERKVTVYGTPWNGKHRLGSNISAPLRSVCLLERGEENSISEIPAAEAMTTLLRQTYRPADPEAMSKTLKLIDRMMRLLRFYRLKCNMEPEAAEVSWRAMRS